MNEFQWTQFCLDNFANVEELLAGIDNLVIIPLFINLHYLITDSRGNTAIVEFYNGKTYTYNGTGLPYPVLSNNHYENSLGYLGNFKGFGGDIELRPDNSSNGRFVKVASMLERERQTEPLAETAFGILDSVSQEDTQWSIVYNISNRSIQYTTKENPTVRTVELNDLDFTCETPVLYVDIITASADTGESCFREFREADNKQLLVDVFNKYNYHNPGEAAISDFLNLDAYGNSIKCHR